jgi:hypothetical protein
MWNRTFARQLLENDAARRLNVLTLQFGIALSAVPKGIKVCTVWAAMSQ